MNIIRGILYRKRQCDEKGIYLELEELLSSIGYRNPSPLERFKEIERGSRHSSMKTLPAY